MSAPTSVAVLVLVGREVWWITRGSTRLGRESPRWSLALAGSVLVAAGLGQWLGLTVAAVIVGGFT